ncbi:hypothetical protein [Pseudobacteriovorax antillogorgiicola]|uniref:PQQ-like domain-containing protein n=1 Tax=Pseudobacteriovorax antillogorgiicola TaxID=1513793 RepID=A0A1Y6CGI4_9BACT|nr:hypothetical protein [Pseudobacteriovorax antillogorgiicola]TCS49084.1 hypothetical protein EDD56_116127 [Pseudobacteriovorax antillogorgiicola]SMF51972.1 hypothetical protein SAMN06296036_11627 [Pseudobacteriovorax antillogorgiicola]
MALQYNGTLLALSMLLLMSMKSSCSSKVGTVNGDIGTPIEEVGVIDTNSSPSDDQALFYSYDAYAGRLNLLDGSSQTLRFSETWQVQGDGLDQAWIAGPEGRFFFGVKDDQLYIYRSGEAGELVNDFAGKLNSYASDPEQGFYVFVDSFLSILVLKVSEDGNIAGSWLGGSILDGESSIKAGDILTGGVFLIATTDGTLLSIDMEQSIAQQTWVTQEHSPAIGNPTWIADTGYQGAHALILDSDNVLYLFDAIDGTIVQQEEVKSVLTRSKSGDDHLIVRRDDNNAYLIHGSDGTAWQEYLLPSLSVTLKETKVGDGYLMAVATGSVSQFYKLRLSDGLVERRVEIKSYDKVGFTTDHIILFQDSPLGYIQMIDFDSSEEVIFSGFNLDSLQD